MATHEFVGRRSVTDWRAADTRRSLWHKTVVGRSLSASTAAAAAAVAVDLAATAALDGGGGRAPPHAPDTVARACTTLKHTRRCRKESLRCISFL